MRRLPTWLLGFGLALALTTAAAGPRTKIRLDDDWQFRLETDSQGEDSDRWQAVNLPHTWNVADSLDKSKTYFRGWGVYRRQLEISPALARQNLYLYFEGANQVAEVFVNGRQAGRHIGGYTAFLVDIGDDVTAGTAEIEVRVDNRHDDTIPPLNADFTFYGGLYRDVWLLALSDVHFAIDDYAAIEFRSQTTSVSEQQARVAVDARLRNMSADAREITVSTALFDPAGTAVARQSTNMVLAPGANEDRLLATFEIDAPTLWSPESPALYRIAATIADDSGILDQLDYPLGLRWFDIDAQTGFHLNGRPYRLVGTNRHQDVAGYGNAVPDDLHRSDMQRIKDDGFNFLRLAHYPQDPTVLDAADELGLIVWEEIPVVNRIDMSAAFSANAERMLREMIRQHRHHASIAFWGYMNEVTLRKPDPVPEGYYESVVELATHLDNVVQEEDASRPSVMALSRDELLDDVPLESIADILAFNLYFGWYYRDFAALGEFLDAYHEKHPRVPLMISEYGAGSDERVHTRDPEAFDFSTEHQQAFHEASLPQILERNWLIGSAVWNQFDFGSSHRQDTRFGVNQKGLWTFDRKPKDIAWYYRAHLSDEPVVHIATRDWQRRAGSSSGDASTSVKVYSNAPTVQMTMNGKPLGSRQVSNRIADWDVVLEAGANEFLAESGSAEDAAIVDYEDRRAFFSDTNSELTLFVNAGGHEQYIDARNRVWEADREYQDKAWGHIGGEGERSHHRIFGTNDDALYQTRRKGSFRYRFDVPAGDYCVTVHKADFKDFRPAAVRRELTASADTGLIVSVGKPGSDDFVSALEIRHDACARSPGNAAAAEPDLPNIIYFLADDIGYGDLGSYGGSLATPNIDALAEAGMRFTDAHSPAALCAPSRFSLLTGSYPYRNGRPGGSWDINFSSGFDAGSVHLEAGRHLTIGDVLQQAGYRTGFIGKMHLGGDVRDLDGKLIREKDRLNTMDFSRGIANGINAHGFDYSFALASGIQHEPFAYFEDGRYRPIDAADPADNSSTWLLMDGRYAVGSNGTSEIVEASRIPARADRKYDSSQAGPVLTERAIAFIADHLEHNRHERRARPFALYYSSQAIHVPHTPPIDFDGDPETIDTPIRGRTGGATTDMIVELDRQVGAIVEYLDAAGVLPNTLIFFTSDNGALPPQWVDYGERNHDSNGPWRDYKASIYEGGHRVPFIMRWGDGTAAGSRIAPGSVSPHTIVNHDWVATTYDLTGQPMQPDQAMDSASLRPLLLGESDAEVHDFILYQAGYSRVGAIREGPWVLVIDENESATELYDLDADPAQTANLVAERGQDERVERLLKQFLRYNDRDDSTFDEPRTTPLPPGSPPRGADREDR